MVEDRTHRMTEIVARLAPGATLETARAEVATAYARMQRDFREAYNPAIHMRVGVLPFKEVLGERARLTLWLLMGAAGFVLIICAANVANLTLMRGVRRERELAARAALGAGVARQRQLLLAENLLVTLLGAGLGVLLAIGGLDLLTSFAARYSPRANEIRLDALVLGFTLTVSLGLALLLSFIPALPREGALASWVAAGGRRITAGPGKHLQRALVVTQVAASLMLLAGAGLLVRTLVQLSNVSTGLETEEVLTMDLLLFGPTEGRFFPNVRADARNQADRIRREIAALPGVSEAGIGTPLLQHAGLWFEVVAEGRALAAGEARPLADMRGASPEYFRAAGIPLLRGRAFTASDRPDSGGVVIVNQMLAERLYGKEDPIGRRIAGTGAPFTPMDAQWRTIVGVVGNIRDGGLDSAPVYAAYFPFGLGEGLAIRTDRDALALVPAATRIIRRVAPTAAVENVKTVTQIRDDSVAPRRLNAALISSFGVLALVLATVGIAGVLAFSVSARTNEIGIRMSLGAHPGRVQRMVLREGGRLLAVGVGLGVIGAVFVARVMQGLLYGVAPYDPPTFTGVALMMTAVGLVACWIPALRAARVDPAIALRSE
jgi:predicted permease